MDNPLFLFSVPCHCFHNIILVPCSLQGIQICDIMSMVTGGFIYLFYLNKIGGGGGGEDAFFFSTWGSYNALTSS